MNEDAVDQRRGEFLGLGIYLGIVVVALAIGLYGVGDSGELWLEDGARYCNNGAMVHDWLLSDQLLDPVSFAKANYAQYPAHSVPYHPPGYAVLLGSWFLTVGFSYASARCFTALCFAVGLCFFHAILRRQGVVAWVALCATLILATSPETARWSRSAMSETPAMTFILAASYCFFRFYADGPSPMVLACVLARRDRFFLSGLFGWSAAGLVLIRARNAGSAPSLLTVHDSSGNHLFGDWCRMVQVHVWIRGDRGTSVPL